MLHSGTIAPPVEATELSGTPWRLADSTQPTLLVFFKISCPTCRLTLPFLQRLHENAQPGSPVLLAISQDDARVTTDFLTRFNIQVPAATDPAWDFPASNAFGITNVPSLFLIEADRTISFAAEGFAKSDLEILGTRFGAAPFRADETVPELRPG